MTECNDDDLYELELLEKITRLEAKVDELEDRLSKTCEEAQCGSCPGCLLADEAGGE